MASNVKMNSLQQSAEDIRREEYEMQLYGCTVNQIYTSLRDCLEDSFNKLVEDLFDKLGENKEAHNEELSAARKGLIKLWSSASCLFYEKLKEVVKENFEIPSHVLLPEDKVHISSHSIEENDEVDKKLQELTKQLESVRMMKQCLEQEKLSIKKSLTLEKRLSELGIFDSLNIDCRFYERTVKSQINKIMRLVNSIDVHTKEDK